MREESKITFFVPGHAITKGSGHAMTSASGKTFVAQNNAKRLRPWQARIAQCATDAGAEKIFTERDAVQLDIDYLLKRPPSHLKKDGTLKDSAPYYPVVRKADIDKMERSFLDALTMVLYNDDSQVCRVEHEKTYCTSEQTPGAFVQATVLPDPRSKNRG